MKSVVDKQIEAAKKLLELHELQSRLPYSSFNLPVESPRKYGIFDDVKDEDAEEIHRISPSLKISQKQVKRPKSERCAEAVAKIHSELQTIARSVQAGQEDYDRLRQEHPRFLTFKAAKSPQLRDRVIAVCERRGRLVGLAQELAGELFDVKTSTVQTYWKHSKPASHRRSK